jgi:uncharacterized RDD family membrane protein YckC
LLIINFIFARPFINLVKNIILNMNYLNYNDTINLLNSNPEILSDLSTIIFFIFLINLIYFSYMEWKFGQTFGQMITGLYVISLNKEKKIWQFIVNNLFVFPFFPFFILWFVDPFYMFYNGRKYTEKIVNLKMEQKYVV